MTPACGSFDSSSSLGHDLRSARCPWGRPWLGKAPQQLLAEDNELFVTVLRYFNLALRLNIPSMRSGESYQLLFLEYA